MIPICLVTGFLGSGKTTFLRATAKRFEQRRLVFLVNDFASVDVDGQLLQEIGQQVVPIAGGSIFCRCLVTKFIQKLRSCATLSDSDGAAPDGLIVEASGVADPRVVQQMLDDTNLSATYRIASIVSLVDPGSFLKLIHTLPNITAQVQAADLLLLNKVDLYDQEVLDQVEQVLHELNPAAEVLRTRFGETSRDLFTDSPVRHLLGQYSTCADPNFRVVRVATERLYLQQLCAKILQHSEDVYRVKGFVPDAQAWRI